MKRGSTSHLPVNHLAPLLCSRAIVDLASEPYGHKHSERPRRCGLLRSLRAGRPSTRWRIYDAHRCSRGTLQSAGVGPADPARGGTARGYLRRDEPYGAFSMADKLSEVGASRVTELDAAGVTVQVLSLDGPGADLVPGDEGVAWARDANDALAGIVAAHPERFAGFAHLPLGSPEATADELSRAVRAWLQGRVDPRRDGWALSGPRLICAVAGSRRFLGRAALSPSGPIAGTGAGGALRRAAR
jgi:hypothetical protein